MVVFLYNCYGEFLLQNYNIEGMWTFTQKSSNQVRAFPFAILAQQAIFSIRTLKLFDPEAKIEIHTNKPNYEHFKGLTKNYSNIKIIDREKLYGEYKKIAFWVYRIRYEAIKDPSDDVIMIDADTYFLKKPTFELTDNTCWISMKGNMGILGLTKKNCKHLIPGIIEQINKEADPTGSEKRAIDEIITLGTMEKNGIKTIETGEWIYHYFDWNAHQFMKNSWPTESLYQELKERAKKIINHIPLCPEDNPGIITPEWANKWKELRKNSDINILQLLHEFDSYADNINHNS